MARDARGLKELLRIVERHCGDLKLRLSVHKSKVMSSVNDLWELHQGEDVVGTMEQVLKFKYLGVQTSLSPSKGAAAMRKRATVCANRYRAACLRLARDGPDVVDVCTTLWRTIAMPSITFGCESVPFCESHFLELQRHQVAVGKFALGLPMSAPNVSVGALLNLQPVKAVIYKAQLKFFTRLLNQSLDRWSKDALLDHLSGKWRSPYMTYISSIKQEIGLVRGPVSRKQVEIVVDHHFSQACRKEVRRMGLSALEPLPKRGRLSFICESEASETLCQWMADQAPLGHKRPREDGSRYRWCPPCSTRGVAVQLTARQASSPRLHFSPCILSLLFASPIPRHVLLECQAACATREETGIAEFMRQAKAAGRSRDSAAQLFLSGKDLEGEPIAAGEWLDRGAALKTLQEQWLASQ